MEKAGLVQRRSDPTDRRVRKLLSDGKAHPLLAGDAHDGDRRPGRGFEGISKSDRETMLEH